MKQFNFELLFLLLMSNGSASRFGREDRWFESSGPDWLALHLKLRCFGLLAWLFIDSFFELDLAVTKNDGLTNSRKMEVDRFQHIDSLKTMAKLNLDVIGNNTRTNGVNAAKRLWIIAAIGCLQVGILFMIKKKNS